MRNKDTDIVPDMLPRYFAGTATESECKIVEEWMLQSKDNWKITEQIHSIYLAADTINILNKVDIEKAYMKVESKISIRKNRYWWKLIQRVAAILFLPFFILFFMEYFNKNTELVQMIHIRSNPGMVTSLVLPDSSIVYLNSGTYLSYPTQFTGNRRNIKLEGEAYFEISEDKKRQFVISTPFDTEVKVYGTDFNVEAYSASNELNITLVAGSVGFEYDSKQGKKLAMMEPGQKITYDNNTRAVEFKIAKVDCEIAWKNGKLIFHDTPFPDVLKALSKKFNVEFIVKRPELESYAFTGTFDNQRLTRIMQYFEISSNIKFRYLNDKNIGNEKERIEIY